MAPHIIAPEVRAIIDSRAWLHDDALSNTKYIVGIDYGTTYSGFGLHTVGSTEPDGTMCIKCFDNWDGKPPGLFSAKLPTVSTYTKTNPPVLEAWGWPAATDFSGRAYKIALPKLALHPDTPPHRRPLIPQGLSILDIVADYLRQLRQVILHLAPDLTVDNSIWCFTVPVNWKAEAMDVMRQAAHLAGMIAAPQSKRLRFCEEPEAAALTCIEEAHVNMKAGETFLVVDAGGGTVDLFQCTMGSARHLDEITVGAGDFLGASFVDALFYAFLRRKIGDDAFEDLTLSPSLSNTWRDVESRWEGLKRAYKGAPPPGSNPSHYTDVITFSLSLYKKIPEEYRAQLRADQGTDDELWITPDDMQSFFDPVVNKILAMVVEQLRGANTVVDYIFFVGGFGSNRYLQTRILADAEVQQRVRNTDVPVQIRQPESAVLKGAVRYGQNRAQIRTRKAKHTLALLVHVNAASLAAAERDANLLRIHGQTYLVLVRKGDTVAYESLVQHAHLALGEHSTTGAVKIFEMDDDGAKPMLIGRITISAPIVPGQKRRVTLLVNFGELELKIRAVNELTGQEWKASIQYDVTQDRSGTVSGTSSTGSSAPPAVKVTTSGPIVQHPVPRQPSPGPGNVTQLTRSMDRLTTGDAYYGGVPAADARRRSSTPSSPAAAPAQGQLPHLPQPLPYPPRGQAPGASGPVYARSGTVPGPTTASPPNSLMAAMGAAGGSSSSLGTATPGRYASPAQDMYGGWAQPASYPRANAGGYYDGGYGRGGQQPRPAGAQGQPYGGQGQQQQQGQVQQGQAQPYVYRGYR
ncbi:hypothetical protein GGF32_004575 [Allomyces javanicus]|nr:hypothetical protein GGF32_004575 [Allomyces javanicus]